MDAPMLSGGCDSEEGGWALMPARAPRQLSFLQSWIWCPFLNAQKPQTLELMCTNVSKTTQNLIPKGVKNKLDINSRKKCRRWFWPFMYNILSRTAAPQNLQFFMNFGTRSATQIDAKTKPSQNVTTFVPGHPKKQKWDPRIPHQVIPWAPHCYLKPSLTPCFAQNSCDWNQNAQICSK